MTKLKKEKVLTLSHFRHSFGICLPAAGRDFDI
jgi:hypothetical protein